MRHLFACLVHERQEVVVDLVRNLSHLEPEATILLYNGGDDDGLLRRPFPCNGRAAVVHPAPRAQRWGALHDFAFDCMRFAQEELPFDTLTIVDSDQLLLRSGYGARLDAFLREHPRAGLLGSAVGPQSPPQPGPIASAWDEADLWLPYCRRFPDGEARFPHWTFWPATVFTAAACRDLVRTCDHDKHFAATMARSSLFASEEIVLPTLVALHGHEVLLNPCDPTYVRYGARYAPGHLRTALARSDAFWAHPIPRRDDDPLRRLVRAHHGEYRPRHEESSVAASKTPPLLLTVPILERMRHIEGWLSDAEADLLVAGLARALSELPAPHSVVEIGCYHGRSTSVLGAVANVCDPTARVHAIDPHDGQVGSLDRGLMRTAPTFASFERNMAAAGLSDVVVPLRQRAHEVEWGRRISFLLVDGLHDYASVSRDFAHFERWLGVGAYVAFHDYAEYFPGVVALVDELLAGGRFAEVARSGSMILLRRVRSRARAKAAKPKAKAKAKGSARAPRRRNKLLVSCVMPTFGRAELALSAVDRFLRQDLKAAELIVVDDSPTSIAGALAGERRVVYLHLDHRESIGAKRNRGCEAARANVLANWDDDDWYARSRLRSQLTALRETGADVTGLNRLLYVEPVAGRGWRYEWPAHARPWVHDATLAFTREFWERNPFPDTSMGIDCRLLWSPTPKEIHAQEDERLYVGVIHAGNTSPKETSAGAWSPHPYEDLAALMAGDPLVAAR